MRTEQYEILKNWYEDYFEKFESGEEEVDKNIRLKRDHTYRVCSESDLICESLNFSTAELYLAKTAALFHDVGRFEQYAKYKTFLDMKSVNHAELAVDILHRFRTLDFLPKSEREIIEKAILFHNRKELPAGESKRTLTFAQILRDADKLDIWRVVLDYYQNSNGVGNGAIEFGLPDTPEVSRGAIESLLAERLVDVNDIKNVNDFKLLLMSWIYDLTFFASLQEARDRGYVEQLEQLLPEKVDVKKCVEAVGSYLDRKLSDK